MLACTLSIHANTNRNHASLGVDTEFWKGGGGYGPNNCLRIDKGSLGGVHSQLW